MSWGDGSARTLLAWLFTYAVHSTILLGGAILLMRWVRAARVRDVLWKTALVGGVISASVQVVAQIDPWNKRFVLPQAEQVAVAERAPRLLTEVPPTWLHVEFTPDAEEFGLVQDTAPVDAVDAAEIPAFASAPKLAVGEQQAFQRPLSSGSASRADWSDWVALGWASVGAVLVALFAFALVRLLAHLGRRRRVVDGPMPALLALLRRRAGIWRPVRLTVSERIEAPLALGTLFPQICVPSRALTSLEPDLQEALLAHELAHIARFDPLWLTVARVIETLFFFQPLNRRARRELHNNAEFLCDAWAVEQTSDRLGLARCLAEVARWIVGEPKPLPVCAMANLQSPLGQRIERILDEEPPRRHQPRAVSGALAAVALGGVCLVPGFATEADRSRELALEEHAHAQPLEEFAATPVLPTIEPAQQAGEVAADPPSLSDLIGAFNEDLETLGAELRSIHALADGRELPADVQARLDDMEHRVRGVRARQHRIQMLLSRLNQTNSQGADSDGTPTNRRERR